MVNPADLAKLLAELSDAAVRNQLQAKHRANIDYYQGQIDAFITLRTWLAAATTRRAG